MNCKEIRIFHNDDQAYEDWVARHEGCVLTKRPKGECMLHDSKCTHPGKGVATPLDAQAQEMGSASENPRGVDGAGRAASRDPAVRVAYLITARIA